MKFQGSFSDLVQALHAVGRTVKYSSEKASMFQIKTELGETVNLYKTGTLVVQGSPALKQKLTDQLIAYLSRQGAPKLSKAGLPTEAHFGKMIFTDEWQELIEKSISHLCIQSAVCDPLRSPSGLCYDSILATIEDYLHVKNRLPSEDVFAISILLSEAIIKRFDYLPHRSSFGSLSHFFLVKGNATLCHPLAKLLEFHYMKEAVSLHPIICELMVNSYLESGDTEDITWDSAFERILKEEDYRLDYYVEHGVHFEEALIYQISKDPNFFDLKRTDKVPESFVEGIQKYGKDVLKWKF